jgi:NADPH-dependent 2,4-dienoyl-CoA reductase/sulfur reductase-like enzyme
MHSCARRTATISKTRVARSKSIGSTARVIRGATKGMDATCGGSPRATVRAIESSAKAAAIAAFSATCRAAHPTDRMTARLHRGRCSLPLRSMPTLRCAERVICCAPIRRSAAEIGSAAASIRPWPTRQHLAVRRMVRTRPGTAGHDDRKSPQRTHLVADPRLRLDPRGTEERRLRGRLVVASCLSAVPPDNQRAQEDLLRRVRPVAWKNPTPKSIYDLAVLGAGPAGLAAAEEAARRGASVALIERDRIGGNSLNAGSIPSKAIISPARLFATVRHGVEYGAPSSTIDQSDFADVMARMRRIRARIAEYHSVDRCTARGIDVFFGDARFVGPNALIAAEAHLEFRKAVIATGARPRASNIPGLEQAGYLTSDSIFDLNERPKRLGIIGGGPLGCELAQAFCRLGSQVIIVQNEPKFLLDEERDAAELLSMSLSSDGVETRLNTTVAGAHRADGAKWIDAVNDDLKFSLPVDEILLSIGRVPNVEELGLAQRASIASRTRHPGRRFSTHAQRRCVRRRRRLPDVQIHECRGRSPDAWPRVMRSGRRRAAEPFDDSLVHLLHAGNRAYRHECHGSQRRAASPSRATR